MQPLLNSQLLSSKTDTPIIKLTFNDETYNDQMPLNEFTFDLKKTHSKGTKNIDSYDSYKNKHGDFRTVINYNISAYNYIVAVIKKIAQTCTK